MGNRVPKEPVAASSMSRPASGSVIPVALDFNTIATTDEAAIENHIRELIETGKRLTDLANNDDEKFDLIRTKTVDVPTKLTSAQTTEIRVETVKIAGSQHAHIKGVRHIMKVSGVSAKYLLDAYNRLNYTSAIDKFTYLVEQAAPISVPSSLEDDVSWCQIAYTADIIGKMFSERDFVTFDFISEKDLLLTSRSCQYPDRPETESPRWLSLNRGRTIRVPLMYYLRIIPDKDDEKKCTIVQFQYSDIGGFIPPKEQTKAVVEFGFDSLPKFLATILDCKTKGVELGPGAEGYLKNPLEPKWRYDPTEMIPGLK